MIMSKTSITKAARGWPVVGNSIARTEFFYSEEGGRFVMAAEVERLESELAAMTARAELAERQVAVLLRLASKRPCASCPAFISCDIRVAPCDENMAAWSRAEAEGGK
jgi:hypothetical protein